MSNRRMYQDKSPFLYFRPCGRNNKISMGFCGKFTLAELTSFTISTMIVFVWVMTGMIRPAALIYVFTCVTVGSVMVFDENPIWFFVSCLSPIFMKRKCHFYRPF